MEAIKSNVTSRVLKTEPINWQNLNFIQQENFKELDEAAKHKLKASILSNNFTQPFYVWEDPDGKLWCLDGKHRTMLLEELLKEGIAVPYTLPATFIDCENKKEASKLILLFSSQYARVTSEGLFDFITLNDLQFEELKDMVDIPELKMDKFGEKYFPLELATDPEDFVIPDVIETDIVEGDLFEIGPHKLLCASSTDPISWQVLMGEEQADLVNTDPPYNVNYEGGTKEKLKIKNDKMGDASFYKFLFDFYSALSKYCKAGASWYVWHADTEGANFRNAMEEAGIMVKQCLIWVKNSMVMGRQDYQWRHEPCLYGWKEGAAHQWNSDRCQTTVLEFDRPVRNDKHPTMKPVKLIAYQIGNSSKEGDIVADGFGGSGTCMVASHAMKRIARVIELDPKYCQVIIDRMRALDPTLLIKKNGVLMEQSVDVF